MTLETKFLTQDMQHHQKDDKLVWACPHCQEISQS